MGDWLSIVLLGSGVIGLIVIFLLNYFAKIRINRKKTDNLPQLINQVLYFDSNEDHFIEASGAFPLRRLTQFFGQQYSRYRDRDDFMNKLNLLFSKLNLIEGNMKEFSLSSIDQKLSILDDLEPIPVTDVSQFVLSILYEQNPEELTLKASKVLANQKIVEALPIFLIKAIHMPPSFDEEIAEVTSLFQSAFPGAFYDRQDLRLYESVPKIEQRFSSFFDTNHKKKISAGLFVMGYLGLKGSVATILQSLKTPVGREFLHIAVTALKKFNHDEFLSDLAKWMLSVNNFTTEEVQDLLSVFNRFYPAGDQYILQLTDHTQLMVQVSAKAAIRSTK